MHPISNVQVIITTAIAKTFNLIFISKPLFEHYILPSLLYIIAAALPIFASKAATIDEIGVGLISIDEIIEFFCVVFIDKHTINKLLFIYAG